MHHEQNDNQSQYALFIRERKDYQQCEQQPECQNEVEQNSKPEQESPKEDSVAISAHRE